MRPTFTELGERLNQNLRNFLTIEVELGMTFARSAKYHKGRVNMERYETSKRNALAALEAIDRFMVRLPDDLRKDIEARRPGLAQIVSTL